MLGLHLRERHPLIRADSPSSEEPPAPAAGELGPASTDAAHERRRRAQGILALLIVQVCFGLFPFFIHLAVGDAAGGNEGHAGFPPRAVAGWRIVFASVVLGSLALRKHGRAALPAAADLPRLVACAVLGIVLNMTLAVEGAARVSVLNAGLLLSLIPVFTYGVSLLVKEERFAPVRASGIALALIGAVILIVGTKSGEAAVARGLNQVTGALLIVINCIGYAIYLVIARPLLARTDPTLFLARVFVIALVLAPPLLLSTDALPAEIGREALIGMGYTLLFPTLLAYFLNAYALARVSSSTTAAFIYLQPLIAGAAGVLFRDERVGAAALLAALCLFIGLGLVVAQRARRAGT